MLSKTTTTFPIETRSLDGVSTLTFNVATELMELYEPGSPLDPTHRVDAVRSASGAPIIFSIGTDNGAYVIFPSTASTTGWDQVDLRAALKAAPADVPADARAYLITASQDRDGTFRIALALAGQSGPRFFVSRDVRQDETTAPDLWTTRLSWFERPGLDSAIGAGNVGKAMPTNILLSTRDDGAGPPTMIAVLDVNQVAHRFFVNTNPDDRTWIWAAYELTQDLERVDDVILGTIPLQDGGLRGTFVIGHNANNQRALYFTSLPENVLSQTGNLNFLFEHLPPNATAIAALPGEIPNAPDAYGTDLYVGGDGLYILRAADMSYYGSDAQPTQIVSAQVAPGIQEIVGSLGGSVVSLWYTISDAQDDLVVVRGTNRYTDPQWMAPVPLFKDVLQIAPLRDPGDQVEDVIMVTGDNRLRYLYHDQATTLWTTHDIAIHDTTRTIDVQCYQLKINVKSSDVQPFTQRDHPFSVSSSQWGYLTVNNVTYRSSPDHPISVPVNERGSLTITQPVTDVSAPVFHIDAPFLTTGFDVHPAVVLNQQIGGMSANDLMQATYAFNSSTISQGGQVLTGDRRDATLVQNGANALRSASALSTQAFSGVASPVDGAGAVYLNRTSKPLNQIDTNKLRQQSGGGTYAWGVYGSGAQWAYAAGEEALGIIDRLGEAIQWYVGDLFRHGSELVTNPTSFFVHLAEDTLKLYVKLEEVVIEVALYTLEQAFRAVSWLLDTLFDIDLSKLLPWLGFLFDFKYYQYTQQTIDRVLSGLLGQIESSVGEAKQFIVGMLNEVEDLLRRFEPNPIPQGNLTGQQAYAQYVAPIVDVGEFLLNNPVGTWIMDKLLQAVGLLTGGSAADWETKLVEKIYDVWQTFLGGEVSNLLETISDLFDRLAGLVNGNLSLNTFLENVAIDTVIHIIEGAKDLVIALFDILDALLDAMRNGMMKEGFAIPILSAIYHTFTGKDLRVNVIEIMEFVAAIPATALAIFATGAPPFEHGPGEVPAYKLNLGLAPTPLSADGAPGPLRRALAAAPAAGDGEMKKHEHSKVDPGLGWAFTGVYGVGRLMDLALELAIAALKFKGQGGNPVIITLKLVQFGAKVLQLVGGVVNYLVAEITAVEVVKTGIVLLTFARLGTTAIAILASNTATGLGRMSKEAAEEMQAWASIADAGIAAICGAIEAYAIWLDWGTYDPADDGMLIPQVLFDYGGDVAAHGFEVGYEYFKVKSLPVLAITDIAIVCSGLLALGLNVARTAYDAERHRTY